MFRTHKYGLLLVTAAWAAAAAGEPAAPASVTAQGAVARTVAAFQAAGGSRALEVAVGKSVVVDSPLNIQRVSIANADLAEAVAVNPREVLINGRAPGATTLILWQQGGERLMYDVNVRPSTEKIETVRRQIAAELPDQSVGLTAMGEAIFLQGTVKDMVSAERAAAMAATLGKVVNLLHVQVPPAEAEVLLKVRFANVDRAASTELGANIISTGALNTQGAITTGQFAAPKLSPADGTFTLGDALNLFLFRRDLNLGATIKVLQSRRLLEILAEPNVLATDGKPASFVAGGEFPFPTLQGGGAGLGAVTIQFREFGVRIVFVPTITPRGTIRLQVTPEVSSLDFANGLEFSGFHIPALATRRVQTEVELESGQSFAIAGLLDNRVTDSWNKIPGLGDIPLIGKIFQSKLVSKSNSELLIMVTPELVRPIPAGKERPAVQMPEEFMEGPTETPRTPGMDITGPVPVTPPLETVPFEQLKKAQGNGQGQGQPAAPAIQIVPVPIAPPANQSINPGVSAPSSSAQGGSGR